MSKREAFNFLNDLIGRCNGKALKLNDYIRDAEMDSLGYLILLTGLNTAYSIVKEEDAEHFFDSYTDMTVKQLINMCVLPK